MRKSLARKLSAYFAILNLVSILTIGIFVYYRAKDALISRTFDQLTSVRIEKQERILNFFSQRIHEIRVIADLSAASIIDVGERGGVPDSTIYSLVFSNRNYSKIYLKGREGNSYRILQPDTGARVMITRTSPLEDSILESVEGGLLDEISIREVGGLSGTSEPEILLGMRLKVAGSDYLLALCIDPQRLDDIMLVRNPMNGLGETGEVYLVGPDLLMRSSSRFTPDSRYRVQVRTNGVRYAFADSTGIAIFHDYRDIPVLSSFSHMRFRELDWVILAEIDREEAMIPIRSFGYNLAYILIILSLLLLGIVTILANTITAPLRKLRKETERISSGNFDPLESIEADGEIADLLQAFNSMTGKIKEQQQNLREAYRRSLSAMIDGQEQERVRLAREIHDGLAQDILAIKMRIESAGPGNAQQVLAESEHMFAELMKEIRSISNDLLPAVLHDFGLARALESLVDQVDSTTGISASLLIRQALPALDKRTETYIYRIAQEAMNNVIRHAEASTVTLELTSGRNELIFQVSDDGKGLPKDGPMKHGGGLSNITERISMLRGKVEFINLAPRGFMIRCTVPLASDDGED